ncbi:MAG: hypothetical protein CMC82_02050 [Flavobacteriaceae bacterium]|nr:hypothetical protein [Flavobacteriaceae bacterium]
MKEHSPNKVVKFIFHAYEKVSADLKLRLRYDNLSQTRFFAGIVKLYLENDPDMMKVMHKVKENAQSMGKQKLRRTIKDLEKGKDIMEQLGITDSDKENLFDMIEMELKDYE